MAETRPEHEKARYWAATEDEEELIASCNERIRVYAESLKTSRLWSRILRNWRYYHNLYYGEAESGSYSGMELKRLGEQGKLVGASFNHFRNFIRHLVSLVTQDKEVFDTRALNTEEESLSQARLGNNILESYVEQDRIDRKLNRALEHSLVLMEGFILTTWDERAGKRITGELDEDTDEVTYQHEGDVKITTPTVFDVIRDLHVRDFENNQWFIVREHMNRWDIIARFPEFEEDIISLDEGTDDFWEFERAGVPFTLTDQVSVFTLYHEACDALPDGKIYQYVGETTASLMDPASPLPYKSIQLRRIVDSEYMLSSVGYSVAADLQGPQEAYNGETSTICTNHKTFGVQNIWVQTGDKVKQEVLEGQLQVVRSRTEPKGLNLTATPPEIFKFRDSILKDMEFISGINSVARGQPEANLRSGTALALVDARALKFASPLTRSYKQLWSDVGTDILRTLNAFANPEHERVFAVTGIHGRNAQFKFKGGSLNLVDRVLVKVGNPLSRTTSGRLEIANLYQQAGLLRLPEHIIEILETGQLDSLVESERSQLQIIRDENEKMLGREGVIALQTDYHTLHIKEHQSMLNSTDVRLNQKHADFVMAHIMVHLKMLMDPGTQLLQATLGFPIGNIPAVPQPPVQGAVQADSSQVFEDGQGEAPRPQPPRVPQIA